MKKESKLLLSFCYLLFLFFSCQEKSNTPDKESIRAINLKRGEIVLCGPPDKQFGEVRFETTCNNQVANDFNLAVSLLHSFEYDEAEKVFAKIIDTAPTCAMAYWGVAMCNFHPMWTAPTPAELKKGLAAISLAQTLKDTSKREAAYIAAIASFYQDYDKLDHHSRCVRFEKAMEKIHLTYTHDKEGAIFYALSLDAAANPADTLFSNQRRAADILKSLYPGNPNHPGIVHYIIHSYDYPGLAILGLDAARKYAAIAPASAHAQHMPSHIFVRLGLWNDAIQSNLISTSAAKCYAENAGIKGHWDEELHGMDYLVYAYLQKGNNKLAKDQVDYLTSITDVYPINFKGAYAFAAIPARYYLENRLWKAASAMPLSPQKFPWEKYPWQKAIIHFTHVLGFVHTNKVDAARSELKNLIIIHDTLVMEKDLNKAIQVEIQIDVAQSWILFKEGKANEALRLAKSAADLEDKTEKHPVTPGEVLPARELLGDMLMETNQYDEALQAYRLDLKRHANRFNGLYGAGLAAEKTGAAQSAEDYYKQLIAMTDADIPERREVKLAATYIKHQGK